MYTILSFVPAKAQNGNLIGTVHLTIKILSSFSPELIVISTTITTTITAPTTIIQTISDINYGQIILIEGEATGKLALVIFYNKEQFKVGHNLILVLFAAKHLTEVCKLATHTFLRRTFTDDDS